MAVDLTLKSTAITNRQATPAVLNSPGLGAPGIVRSVQGYLASVTAALSITSIIRMVEVPAHAVVQSVTFAAAAQGAGKFDIGVYRTNADGGAVCDVDLFASAVDCASAVALTDVTNESTNYTLAKQNQRLWEAAGISTEPAPGTMLDIALTVVTTDVTTGAAAVLLKAQYTI